jgi:histidine triad (HIT) family protein
MSEGCIFCAIAAGNVPAAIVASDEHHVAFLDARPVFEGHVLVIPREHHETLPELPVAEVGPLFELVQRVADVLPGALDAAGTWIAVNNVVSQSVPHVHVHVVPRRFKDGLRGFFWPRTTYASDQARDEVAARIREALAPE